MRAQTAFTQAAGTAQDGAETTVAEMAEHGRAFQATIAQATGDYEKLAAVRDQFMALMTVEKERLAPLRELLEAAGANPRDQLHAAAEARRQVTAATAEHARLTAQVAALSEQLVGLHAGIEDARKKYAASAALIQDVTGSLVRANGQLTATQQAAALQEQQRRSSAGHHGAGAMPLTKPQGELLA
jgi:chromosome segregation ATPase